MIKNILLCIDYCLKGKGMEGGKKRLIVLHSNRTRRIDQLNLCNLIQWPSWMQLFNGTGENYFLYEVLFTTFYLL